MAKHSKTGTLSGFSAALLYASAAALIAIPSAGFALGALDGSSVSLAARGSFASFTPASVDPRLARFVAERSSNKGKLMRFTPAGAANRPNRSVTVAIRVDADVARAISARTALATAKTQASGTAARIAPTRFNLGLSRGYQSFAHAPLLAKDLSDASMPDLASFLPSQGAKNRPSRFNARVELEEAVNAGSSPRTLEALGDQMVDVGGSYSVTRNLDVTAGVRYLQDRDRIIAPLTNGKQDSQAVYVGTQFRF